MRPYFHTLLLLLFPAFILPFIGCEKPTQPSAGTWTISGITYLAGLRDPVPGVVVKCAGLNTTSGNDGSYRLRGVPEGKQILIAEKLYCETYLDTIDVHSDTKRYVYLSVKTTKLWGLVTNPIDGPIQGATLERSGIFATTDASGRYQFDAAPQGTDTLYISQPDYISSNTCVTLDTPERQFDAVLSRDRTIEGKVTEDTFVGDYGPDRNFSSYEYLTVSTNGSDTLQLHRSHTYLKMQFPELLRDSRVSLIEGSLQLWLGSTASASYQVYAVGAPWTASSLTWNNQPATGPLLYSALLGDGNGGKYWTVLASPVLDGLVADWLANQPAYGIAIKGGPAGAAVAIFESTRAVANQPKLTFRVHY
jgi:hypothetical protein